MLTAPSSDLLQHCPCPPTRVWDSRVSGLAKIAVAIVVIVFVLLLVVVMVMVVFLLLLF